ncbi:hypothetical protein JOQ06_004394 [Pogonophryne albipinna]|uniref:Uncharacterized protein n=1 Tax=Pogonophryne albipinna TaxID=1090488 RepID=A0AAD6FBG5_9TELE|nr:hypothetical protein JOQ06_004394 [Pogonophryne albipinna]
MDANTENMTETSRISKDEPQKTLVDNTFRGRGFRSRGRMSRGGMRGGRGMIKGFGPPGYGRGRGREGAMNGFAPMRGMRRMRPYPDMRGHRGTDPVPPLLQVTLLSEGLLHTLEAAACPPLDLHATFTPEAQEATTMDQSLLLLTTHLAEARGGQGPLVADAFNTACPKNNNQTLVNAEGAHSGAVNAP